MTKPYKLPPNDKKTALIVWLDKEGILKDLYSYGIITPRVAMQLQARLKVVSLMRQKVTKTEAIKRVASLLRVSVQTVYRYLE